MTAPAPSYIWCSTANATVAAADTLTNLGFQVGDRLVVVQLGIASGAAAPVAPSAPTGLDGGADTSGTLGYQNSGTSDGRIQAWSKTVAAGDLTATVTVDRTGYGSNTHRFVVIRVPPGAGNIWSVTGKDLFNKQVGNTNPQGAFSFSDPTRPAIAFAAFVSTTLTANTVTWDGGAARTPYVDGNSGNTTTTGGHSNHFGSGANTCWLDYNEYDEPSGTLASVNYVSALNNTTHAMLAIVFEVAQQPAFTNATESDTAQALTHSRTKALGAASEADAAGTIVRASTFTNVTETDAAQALARTKTRALGAAAESDIAQRLPVPFRPAAESDQAQTLVPQKSGVGSTHINDPAAGSELMLVHAKFSKNYPVDSGEVSLGVKQSGVLIGQTAYVTVTGTPTDLTYTLPTPLAGNGSGFDIVWFWRTFGSLDLIPEDVYGLPTVTLVAAAENDAGQPLTRTKTRALVAASEADTAQVLVGSKTRVLIAAAESDTAQPFHAGKGRTFANATEADTALALHATKTRSIAPTIENDEAQNMLPPGAVPTSPAAEHDAAQPLSYRRNVTFGAAGESDHAQALLVRRVEPPGSVEVATRPGLTARVRSNT